MFRFEPKLRLCRTKECDIAVYCFQFWINPGMNNYAKLSIIWIARAIL